MGKTIQKYGSGVNRFGCFFLFDRVFLSVFGSGAHFY